PKYTRTPSPMSPPSHGDVLRLGGLNSGNEPTEAAHSLRDAFLISGKDFAQVLRVHPRRQRVRHGLRQKRAGRLEQPSGPWKAPARCDAERRRRLTASRGAQPTRPQAPSRSQASARKNRLVYVILAERRPWILEPSATGL